MKNNLTAKLFLGFCLIACFQQIQAQDSIPERVINSDPLAVQMPNTFDFVFQRDYMLGSGDADTASLRGSGSWFIGLGFKIPFADNRFGIRVTPGINWLKINYDHTDSDKQFPIIGDTVVSNLYPDLSTITDPEVRALVQEQLDALASRLKNVDYELQRHRLTYVDVPVGIYANLTRDENRKGEVFVEGGGLFRCKRHQFGETCNNSTNSGQSIHCDYDGIMENFPQNVIGEEAPHFPSVEDFLPG